jgi:hypothetical protein
MEKSFHCAECTVRLTGQNFNKATPNDWECVCNACRVLDTVKKRWKIIERVHDNYFNNKNRIK